MSLAVVVKSPSGLVLAADSRLILTAGGPTGPMPIHFDNATKLLRFNDPHNHVAAVTFGAAVFPGTQRTAESFLPELEAKLPRTRVAVDLFAEELANFYLDQWSAGGGPSQTPGPAMVFYIGGYDDGAPYGAVFQITIPHAPKPVAIHQGAFGVAWGGQMEIVDRVVKGHERGLREAIISALGLNPAQQLTLDGILAQQALTIPVDVMALQDCVDLAIALIRTTMSIQQLTVQLRGVGGPIDVVTITRPKGVRVVQFKEVTGHER